MQRIKKLWLALAQRVAVARAPVLRDTTVQHCLEYLGSENPEFELEGRARLVVQSERVLPEAAPCVAYAPIDLKGQVGIMIDFLQGIRIRSFGCTPGPLLLR